MGRNRLRLLLWELDWSCQRLTNPRCLQDPSHRFKGDVMDLRLDIERRKRFAGKDRGRSPGGSRGPSRERSSEKSGKHHKKSKYVPPPPSEHRWFPHWARSNNFSHPPSVCPSVRTGSLKRSATAPRLPPRPRPPPPPTRRPLEVKTTWGRGWSTRRRATITHASLRGTTVAPRTEAPGITRATTRREVAAEDL